MWRPGPTERMAANWLQCRCCCGDEVPASNDLVVVWSPGDEHQAQEMFEQEEAAPGEPPRKEQAPDEAVDEASISEHGEALAEIVEEDAEEAPISEHGEAPAATSECPKTVMVFLTKQKERKEATFTKKPLGIQYRDYNMQVLSVKKSSPGEECGVELGWCLVEIDGTVLDKNSKRTQALIKVAVGRLPSSTDSNNDVK